MRKTYKTLLLAVSAGMIACASAFGTLAYFTAKDTADNTFTVGQVQLKLDEAKVDENGRMLNPVERVQENHYKLMPGGIYDKDPTVTVLQGSTDCYVRMLVTISNSSQWDEIFEQLGTDASLTDFFGGYKEETWIYQSNEEDEENNTRTYEFWYREMVKAALTEDNILPPLFETIMVPGELTGEQLEALNGFDMNVTAHAVQASGFENAGEAWEEFPDNL